MPIPGVTSSSDNRQPGTPTIGAATAGNASVSVAFTAPDNTGKPNTSLTYTATTTPGSITGTGSASPVTISGLSNGTSYTAVVKLNNTVQDSLSSAATSSFTPIAPPFFPFFPPFFPFFPPFFPGFMPTGIVPTFGANTSTTTGFTGSVTNYDGGSSWNANSSLGSVAFSSPSGSILPFTVTGLSAGQSSTVTVFTVAAGFSNGSATTTGTAVPSITNLSITPAYNGGFLSWSSTGQASYMITTSPSSNLNGSGGNTATSRTMTGGTQLTQYTVTVTVYSGSSQTGTSASSTITFTTTAAP
jgi:hypothetical protein